MRIFASTLGAAFAALALAPQLCAAPLSDPYPGIDPGTVGTAYSKVLYATGGKPPYVWTLTAGTIAPGIAVIAKGSLSGTPTKAGDYKFTVTCTDAAKSSFSIAEDMWVGNPAGSSSTPPANPPPVTPPPAPTALAIPYPNLDPGTIGTTYNKTMVATGGTLPYVWTATGLPPGITISPSGTLSGNPTQDGGFNCVLQVKDAANATVQDPQQFWISGGTASTGDGGGSSSGGSSGSGSSGGGSPPPPPATLFPTAMSGPTIPQPVTGHPRLWLTAADLPRLQNWAANPANVVYQKGLVPVLATVMHDYATSFFPGGTGSAADVPNSTYPDFGDTQGYTGLLTEQEGLVLALQSLIDPNPALRPGYAQRARNLVMYAMQQAAAGPLANAPFRDPLFAVYNRANFTSEAWPLIVDWIYPTLSSQDKATIRAVFLQWATACLNASTTGGDHPTPTGVVNSSALLPGGNAYRMASNNYYLGHARLLTMMSLALDPADDPVINAAQPASAIGNTLRSYLADATGAWLFQEYAMLGDPANVRTDFQLPASASVGLASGGLPPEGMLYGHSYSFIFGELLALKTAGFADPSLIGAQAALANDAPVFDRFVKGMVSSLTPAAQVYPGYAYMGPVYQMASYGDILRLWITPDFVQPFALLALLDQQNGDNSRLNAERWFAVNAVEGGAANLVNRVSNPWSYGVQDALLAFLLLDPTAPAATDPRPGYPTAFYDAPQGRLIDHTDWSTLGNMFDFRCSWISINHQQADAGQFEFYRKGEWLTKGVANYDNTSYGLTNDYHNSMSLKNWCANGTPTTLGWWEGPFWTEGSQWQLGGAAGDPNAMTSVTPAYTYAFGDTTNLYNKPSYLPADSALDIQHCSRSILWLKPDHIVIYDRATSKTAGLFKRLNFAVTAAPSVGANQITVHTPGGQQLFITSLLPAGATVTTPAIGSALQPMAELEPSRYRVVIEDPTDPTDVRYLTVLQGADGGVAADPTAVLQSASGTAFDGVLLLDTDVLFKRDMPATFAGFTYVVPGTTLHHYVCGLTPNSGFTVSVVAANGSETISVQPGGPALSDQAGVLLF